MGYTKLDENLVTSSMWSEDDKTLRVWVYLMARAGANGAVLDTVPAIARACAYDVATVQAILEKLSAPDVFSRTPELDGRRIAIVHEPEFAIHLVNHKKYRAKDHNTAARSKAYRDRKRHGSRHGASRSERHASCPERKQKHKHKQKHTENGSGADEPRPFPSQRAADVFKRFYPDGVPAGVMFKTLRPLVIAKTWDVVEPQMVAYLERVPIDFHNWPKFAAGFGRWHEAPNVRGKPATAENRRVLDEWERKILEAAS